MGIFTKTFFISLDEKRLRGVGYINHIDKKFFYYFSQVQPLILAVEILILVIECTKLLGICVLIQSRLLLGGSRFFHTRANVPSWCKFLITYMKTWN